VTLQGLDVVIIGALAGSAEAGRLAAVSKWEQPIALIAGAYSAHAFPALAAKASHRSAIRSVRPMATLVVVGMVMVVIAVLIAPWLISTILGSRYAGSAVLLRWALMGSVLVLVAQPLAVLLQARDQEHYVAVVTVTMKVTAVLAVSLLADTLGAVASPLAAGVSTAAIAVAFAFRTRQLWHAEQPVLSGNS
jgi:O-antigen/teichoic acid export membrane protein